MYRFTPLLILVFAIFALCLPAVAKSSQNYYILSPDGKYTIKIGVYGDKTKVRIVKSESMELVSTWNIPDFKATQAKFSNQNQLLISDSQKIKLYRIKGEVILEKSSTDGLGIAQTILDQKGDILWSTSKSVFKTEATSGKTKKIGEVESIGGKINSISSLQGGEVVVSQEKSSAISWFSEQPSTTPLSIAGDGTPIVGTFSDDGLGLFAVSAGNRFLGWDVSTKKVIKQVDLNLSSKQEKPLAVSLDEKGERLWIAYGNRLKFKTVEHKLSNLKSGINRSKVIKANLNQSNVLFRNVESLLQGITDSISIPEEESPAGADIVKVDKKPVVNVEKRGRKVATGNYSLAKIEADNGDFEAALKFIHQVPTNDPDFKKSRELQKKIHQSIELRNSLNAAQEQYAQGNFESARILVDNILAEMPTHPGAKHLRAKMEKHLTPGGKIFFLLLILVVILLSLAALYWYKKEDINRWWQRNKPAIPTTVSDRMQQKPQKQTSSEESSSEDRVLRRKYLLRFNETKTFLRETLAKDHAGVHLEKWKEFAAHLRKIEKKATSSSKNYNALIDQLNHLQELIKAVAKSKTGDHQNSQNRTDQKQKTRQQKSKPQIQDLPDYYKVLGVSEYSSVEEIKKAFRKKMQQYHPDKHNSSDFEWIKKEATKMSQLVQEAHEVLNDPLKRKEYNENYRAQKRVKL